MNKLIQKKITVAAGATVADYWDLDERVRDIIPRVRRITCLNDLSALRGKTEFTLENNSSKVKYMDKADLFAISSAIIEKFDIDTEGGRFNYSITNLDAASQTFIMNVELEYPF